MSVYPICLALIALSLAGCAAARFADPAATPNHPAHPDAPMAAVEAPAGLAAESDPMTRSDSMDKSGSHDHDTHDGARP